MKKQCVGFLIFMIGICSACSLEQEQELIIVSKNKKKYVTKEQCIDLTIDCIMLLNECNQSFNILRQTIDTIQKEDLDMLSDYADGEKECFFKRSGKIGLTNYYEKEMKKKHDLERCIRKINQINQDFQLLRAEMQKIQAE
jgi:hypothetical protein